MSIRIFDPQLSSKIAQALQYIGAIQLRPHDPFTWASGWKSPIYCDNRLSLSFSETRTLIKHSLVKVIESVYPEVEAIAGVATAGIPQGVLVADAMDLPFLYVRAKAKDHGMTNRIEGHVVKHQKVVVIEDLVSTGSSSLSACKALRDEEVDVLGMAAIFTYAFPLAEKNFAKQNVPLTVLSDYPSLVNTLTLDAGTIDLLNQWREDPEGWGNR